MGNISVRSTLKGGAMTDRCKAMREVGIGWRWGDDPYAPLFGVRAAAAPRSWYMHIAKKFSS